MCKVVLQSLFCDFVCWQQVKFTIKQGHSLPMSNQQSADPLHGITLEQIVSKLDNHKREIPVW